jgi:predicted nucleotidyltransferase
LDAVTDFEDILDLLDKHGVKYLIIGGLAFIYHAKPRYTKDMDLWIEPSQENVLLANRALVEFGSPYLLDASKPEDILQLGLPPDRIDFFLSIDGPAFETAWQKRIQGTYGRAKANWIAIDSLISIKSRIDQPRHEEDVRVLSEVRDRHRSKPRKPEHS